MSTMQFRRLRAEELEELQDEFIRFLAVQSITGPDWEQMKTADPQRAENLIDKFSDVVFTKVTHNVKYLELKRSRDIRTFHCQEDKILMNGILLEGESDLDLRQNIAPEQMLQLMRKSGAKLKMFSGEKTYQPSREEEIFKLMEQGALISKDGALYLALEELKK